MEGPPNCGAADLRKPRLRKCAFDANNISWLERLGGGRDGYCWKVRFGDEGPFVLKMFWDKHKPPTRFEYLAFEGECRNAALLQMMEAAVEEANASGQKIMVCSHPVYWQHAIDNIQSFSTDMRENPEIVTEYAAKYNLQLRSISSVPRLRKCYGWLPFHDNLLRNLPTSLQPPPVRIDHKLTRTLNDIDTERVAIIYEYVERKENELAKVQEAVDFFYLVGFHMSTSLRRNWESSVLLDLSDLTNPYQTYWNHRLYKRKPEAENILKNLTTAEYLVEKFTLGESGVK
ncbi:hypothetical protein SPI_03435 [Niveomyces insectorum RCEF 264]|uniref:Protein kinase-like domain protein n=1 Tax=Niveomyces insectorum RCEF 264 TaxID=1081102 RepID=A0A162J3I4_9HYPO|nr:hypothetical protein SPI_03435 [Niveomyces insectorum RCEF 264]